MMMPIVFWASFAPWPRLKSADDTSCSRRNQRSILPGCARRTIHATITIIPPPSSIPSTGEITMNSAVFAPPDWMTDDPHLQKPAPIRPPTSACDELDGRPYHQVIRFQAIDPPSAPHTHAHCMCVGYM